MLHLDALLRDFPDLRDNFQWFCDPAFLKRQVDVSMQPRPGPMNMKILPHVERLDVLGITEKLPKAVSSSAWYQGVFCVPKKAPGTLRFIMSCCVINRALDMSTLPRCILPSYDEILRVVFSGTLVLQFDFKSFFFQFGLPQEVRHLFAFRARNLHRRMTRLPMGYSPAPQAAQALTLKLVRMACDVSHTKGIAWIDNAIFSGNSLQLAEVHRVFTSTCAKYNICIGAQEAPAAYTTLLGIEVDLRQRRWRMDPSWVAKTLPAAQLLLLQHAAPLRLWWRLCGALLWRFHALRLSLYGALPILTWMSTTSRCGIAWDENYPMEQTTRVALRCQTDSLSENAWRSWVTVTRPVVQVVCDASLTGWAVVLEDMNVHHGKFWGDLASATIFRKELFAAYKAVKCVCNRPRWKGHSIMLYSDNQAVIGAIKKGITHVEGCQYWLDLIRFQLEDHECEVRPEYVPTAENVADQYTRL